MTHDDAVRERAKMLHDNLRRWRDRSSYSASDGELFLAMSAFLNELAEWLMGS